MELLNTENRKTDLIINAGKYGNLAKFLSGINNFKK